MVGVQISLGTSKLPYPPLTFCNPGVWGHENDPLTLTKTMGRLTEPHFRKSTRTTTAHSMICCHMGGLF